jgi:UDPglucose 6-dehydrogenase
MGNDVTCVDIDEEKVVGLTRCELPIYEPGLAGIVRRNLRDQRLSFTTDLAVALDNAAVCFIAVGTPPDEDGSADRRHVMGAARAIAETHRGPLVVAVKSTVPVGTCDAVEALIRERATNHEVHVVSNPEFLKEGKAVDDFMRPDRIVVGAAAERAANIMRRLYEPFVRSGHPVLFMDRRSAEMAKYAANAMLATRISLMNEIAQICDKIGADIRDVRRGIGADPRIGNAFLYPGAGYGGSCFPKDVKALSSMAVESDCPADILDAVEKVNRHQKMLLANRVIAHFGGEVRDRRIALWGLSFKPMTDDIRDAPALTIIKRLTDAGATVCAHDPEAMLNAKRALAHNPKAEFAPTPYTAAEGADALVLVTEWGAFRSPDFHRLKAAMRSPVVFDGRNLYDPKEMREFGFIYSCIGRPNV